MQALGVAVGQLPVVTDDLLAGSAGGPVPPVERAGDRLPPGVSARTGSGSPMWASSATGSLRRRRRARRWHAAGSTGSSA